MHSSHIAHYYYRINDYTSMIVFNLLPIALLIILNGRLILTLRKIAAHQHHLQLYTPPVTTSQRGSNESTTRRNISANAMLFAVALMLFVCLGPQIPARFLFDYFGTYHRTTVVYSTITQQLVLLNASLNFCLYCLVSRRYRSLLRLTVKRLFAAMNCNREYKEDIRPVYVWSGSIRHYCKETKHLQERMNEIIFAIEKIERQDHICCSIELCFESQGVTAKCNKAQRNHISWPPLLVHWFLSLSKLLSSSSPLGCSYRRAGLAPNNWYN